MTFSFPASTSSNSGIINGNAPSANEQFLSTAHWVAPVYGKQSEPCSASPSSKAADAAKNIQNHEKLAASPEQETSKGRVDKRKRRHPTRSLSAHDITRHIRPFHSLKMPFLDDYQRNPTAYSRALMDIERPSAVVDRHIVQATNSSSQHTFSAPMVRGGNTVRVPSPLLTLPPPPLSLHPEHKRVPAFRKSMSAAIQRLFPSLGDIGITAAPTAHVPESVNIKSSKISVCNGELETTNVAGMGLATPQSPLLEKNDHTILSCARHPNPAETCSLSSSSMDSPATSAGSVGSSPQPSSFPVGTGQYTYDELSQEIFNLKPVMATCSVRWNKAAPMDVTKFAMAEYLSQAERDCCSVLRLYPEQYLAIKQSLVRAGRNLPPGTFKKRDAQKLCRVDVNKTSKVFEWFCKLGWIPQVASRAHINYNCIGDNSNKNSDGIKVDNEK